MDKGVKKMSSAYEDFAPSPPPWLCSLAPGGLPSFRSPHCPPLEKNPAVAHATSRRAVTLSWPRRKFEGECQGREFSAEMFRGKLSKVEISGANCPVVKICGGETFGRES